MLNIVSIHSGFEHINLPDLDDIKMARRFAEICPYVYYGHHPHVVQGVELVQGSLIAYSLGNFCFDDVYTTKSREPLIKQSENNRRGLILEIEVRAKELVKHRLTPTILATEELRFDSAGGRERIEAYSRALREPVDSYRVRRKKLVSDYIASRKDLRNIEWYLKRINFASVRMLLCSNLNRYRYRRNVSDFLVRRDSDSDAEQKR